MEFLKYRCHYHAREATAAEIKNKLIVEACIEFNIDITKLSIKSKEKVICMKRRMISSLKQRQVRIRNIVAKLLKEYKRQAQIDNEQCKTYDYKVKRKERIMKDMSIEGTTISLVCY